MLFALLFILAAALNIVLGAHEWAGVLAGSLNDPDSYMRLLRIEQGLHAGRLVNMVARDDSGAGVLVEWSKLLDMLLVAMAAPMAAFIGWHRALFAAGVALGPLSVGALGATLAWVAEPFAARGFLWAAAFAAATLPGILIFEEPGAVHYHVLLLALIAATAGFVVRAWQADAGAGFLAGVSGGFAIWLTPETMPFILMAFAALLIRWQSTRLGGTMTACAAGFFDVLGFALAIDPPHGGYGVAQIDRLSLVYVLLGFLLLAGSFALWRMEKRMARHSRPLGVALMAVVILGWIAIFPKVAMGPYGIMSRVEMRQFFGMMLELQPAHGVSQVLFLLPGGLALAYALCLAMWGRARLLWAYISLCLLVAIVLGARYVLFVGFGAAAAACLLPLALSDVSFRLKPQPGMAAAARLALLALVLGPPAAAALAPRGAAVALAGYPSCSLRHIAPLLAPLGNAIVIAQAEYTPEILYRSGVETVGSLYQHGVPGYLRLNAAWQSIPGAAEPKAIMATGASFILFCPQAARYRPVADLPRTTLWDALESGTTPPWLTLSGQNKAGWRLYKIGY